MPKYLLLLTGPGDYAKQSPSENEQTLKEYMQWTRGLAEAGKLVGAERLDDQARVIEPGANPTVTDGPFAESKEAVGGYFAVNATDVEEATQLALGCPHLKHGGYVRIHPIYDMSGEMPREEAAAARA